MSNEIKLIPYDEKYLDKFQYNGVEQTAAEDFNINEVIKNYAQLGGSYMLIENEKLIGVGGIFSLWGDLGQAWVFLNKEIKLHKKFVFKAIKDYVLEAKKKYTQIQILCLVGSVEAGNLIEHLGFEPREVYIRYIIRGD